MDKKRLKIAYLSRFFGTVNRGVESHVFELSKRLKKWHDVDVLEGHEADNLQKVLKGKYDLVIPTNGGLQALKVSLGRMFSKYKLLIVGHSGVGRGDMWNLVVARPDIFVVLTDYMAENWRTKLAHEFSWNTKIVKIPNGIDLDKFTPRGEKLEIDLPKPIILSVGAIEWYKQHALTIQAVSLLNKKSLLIVGSGSKEQELQKLGAEKLGGRFKIIKVAHSEMPKVYRAADLFTLPSWDREAFGIVYLEAMASGLACVAPDDSPRREIIGEAGLFVDCFDKMKYAKALESALAKNWNSLPRKQAEKFSWEKVTSQYLELFEEMFYD